MVSPGTRSLVRPRAHVWSGALAAAFLTWLGIVLILAPALVHAYRHWPTVPYLVLWVSRPLKLTGAAEIQATLELLRFRLLLFWIVVFVLSTALWTRLRLGETKKRWIEFTQRCALVLLVAGTANSLIMGWMHLVRMDSFSYSEGWNAFHAVRFVSGGQLYMPMQWGQVIPVTYPPLSFLLMGVLAHFTRNLITIGRGLSFASLLGSAYLCYRITTSQWHKRVCGIVAALACIASLSAFGPSFIGTYDPEMLGRFVSLAGLAMYVEWRSRLTLAQVVSVAAICSLALFFKQTLIAVPLTIAIVMSLDKKWRLLFVYVVSGVSICLTLLLIFRIWFGPEFLHSLFGFNILLFNRFADMASLIAAFVVFAVTGGALYCLLGIHLIRAREHNPTVVMPYLVVALVASSYVLRGTYGVGNNAWFDVLIALSLAMGDVAAIADLRTGTASAAWAAILAAAAGPAVMTGPFLGAVYPEQYRLGEAAFARATAALQQAPGETLFEEPMIGFCSGKSFKFDTFLGSQFILGGALPESDLVQAIRSRQYSMIQTNFDVQSAVGKLPAASAATAKSLARLVITERWTDNSVRAIDTNYRLQTVLGRYFLYVPRDPGSVSTGH